MIDQATLQAATTKLLLDSMSAEDREKLLTTALTHVLTPVKSGSWPHSKEESPLQEAFNRAATVAAGQIVQEYFKTPEVKSRLRKVVDESLDKAFDDKFANLIASKMVNGLWSER